jgi:4-amino-4-deoxychorismate lyase
MPAEGPLRDGNGPDFGLIETLRWEPAAGFVRLERHLTRLSRSVAELGFGYEPARIDRALAGVGGGAPLRVRLLLSREGAADVTAQPFVPLPENAVWTLRIAATRLGSGDPLLRHKTTRRDVFQWARAEFSPDEADEVILLNENGLACEGTITSLFADLGDGGPLRTSPLSCGLLPGVLRGELLDTGEAREAELTPADLMRAKRLFVGNSLRGLIAARLSEDSAADF